MQRWSALQKVLDGDTLAQENNVTEETVQAVRFAVDHAVPVQLEYGALKPVFAELPRVYDGELTVLQLLSQAAQAHQPPTTPGVAAVDTPAPTHAPASTTILFVPDRDQRGAFEKNAYEALIKAFRRQNPDIQVQIKTFTDLPYRKRSLGTERCPPAARESSCCGDSIPHCLHLGASTEPVHMLEVGALYERATASRRVGPGPPVTAAL